MKFSRFTIYMVGIFLFFIWLGSSNTYARYKYDSGEFGRVALKAADDCRTHVGYGVHNVGRIGLTVANMGHFGKGFLASFWMEDWVEAEACFQVPPYLVRSYSSSGFAFKAHWG